MASRGSTTSGLSKIQNFLEENWMKGKIPQMLYEESPLLQIIPKKKSEGGLYEISGIITGAPQGVARTRSVAQTTAAGADGSNIKSKNWIVERGTVAQSIYVTEEEINASSGSAAFFEELGMRQRLAAQAMGQWLSRAVVGELGRYIGVGSIVYTTGVITLTDIFDATRFAVGQAIQASANDGSGSGHALLDSSSVCYVKSVNPEAGTVTVSSTSGGTAGAPAGWATAAYFFDNETFSTGGTTNLTMHGFGAWLPASAPTSGDSFCGQDRSLAPTELSGIRIPSSKLVGKTMSEKLQFAAMWANNVGTTKGLTHFLVNPEDNLELCMELENKGIRPLEYSDGNKKFGFTAVTVMTATGPIPVIADRSIKKGVCFGVTMPADGSNICLVSKGELPYIINSDGQMMTRLASADTYEQRLIGFPALIIRAPGWCVRFSI